MKKPVIAVEIGGTAKLLCRMVVNMGMTGSGTQVTMLSKMMEAFQDRDFMETCLNGDPDDVKKKVQETLGN